MHDASVLETDGPLVTIGLPVYNGENFIAEALDSILSQTYRNFELVITDNASTDRTQAICERYAARDPRIRYHRFDQNAGAAKNYNRAFELSQGKYFKWAAHDDLLYPEFLKTAVEVFENAQQNLCIVYSRVHYIDGKGETTHLDQETLDVEGGTAAQRLFLFLQRISLATPVFGLMRSDYVARTGLIGSFIASDYVFLAQAIVLGGFRELPEPLIKLRIHAAASRHANTSNKDVLRWFDPKARMVMPVRLRLFWEYLRGMFALRGLGAGQKLVCAATVLVGFPVKRLRVFAGRLRRKVTNARQSA